MNKSNLDFLLTSISVIPELYYASEKRDQKIIKIMGFMVFVSSFISGFAIYTTAIFIFQSMLLAWIISLCTGLGMLFHHQSLLATDKSSQVTGVIIVSAILALAYTVTSNASKDYDSLYASIEAKVVAVNSNVTKEKNDEIELIELEEKELRAKLAKAAEIYHNHKQPRADAIRAVDGFMVTKHDRIERVKESYSGKYVTPNISRIDILVEQAKGLFAGNAESLIALLIAFVMFLLECICPILRQLLGNNSDYLTRYIANLKVLRDLRDQKISQQAQFVQPDSNLLGSLLQIKLIDKKCDLVNSGFDNEEEMLILDQRQKILQAGFNPFSGMPLDHIDFSIFKNNSANANGEDKKHDDPVTNNRSSAENSNGQTKGSNTIFDI